MGVIQAVVAELLPQRGTMDAQNPRRRRTVIAALGENRFQETRLGHAQKAFIEISGIGIGRHEPLFGGPVGRESAELCVESGLGIE